MSKCENWIKQWERKRGSKENKQEQVSLILPNGSDIQPITVKLAMASRESSARDSRETHYVFEHLDDAVS